MHRGLDGRYYVIDTSRLFPPERPPKHKLERGVTTAHLYCLLRPEFVKSYPLPLSSDGFCRMGDHHNLSHNAELTEATRYLKQHVIPEFCQTLLRSSMWYVAHSTNLYYLRMDDQFILSLYYMRMNARVNSWSSHVLEERCICMLGVLFFPSCFID